MQGETKVKRERKKISHKKSRQTCYSSMDLRYQSRHDFVTSDFTFFCFLQFISSEVLYKRRMFCVCLCLFFSVCVSLQEKNVETRRRMKCVLPGLSRQVPMDAFLLFFFFLFILLYVLLSLFSPAYFFYNKYSIPLVSVLNYQAITRTPKYHTF